MASEKGQESVASYIMRCAKVAWSDYKLAETEQERQEAADAGAELERMAVDFYGEKFADRLPWNRERARA